MAKVTYYIVPAWSDQAGQCRIYRLLEPVPRDAGEHYRKFPGLWKSAGIMNSRGELVCFGGPKEHAAELRDCTLHGGFQITLEEPNV